MRKIVLIVILVIVVAIMLINNAYAQTSTPTTKPTATPASTTPKDSQIEKIKDLVASRVAELKLVDKKGIVGYVKSSTNTQITVTNAKGREAKIDIDELTKFTSPDEDETFGISDVKNGDLLSLIGLYNKQTEKLLARFVEVASNIPQNLEGVVIALDDDEFTIDIALADGKKKTVNIETSTKTNAYEEGETIKSGFSKIETGERVIVVGFTDKNDENTINASRITRFPGMPLSNELKKAAADSVTKDNEATPTVKASPTSTR